MRRLVRETHPSSSHCAASIYLPRRGRAQEIGSMPGNFQLSVDELVKECEAVQALGIGGVILRHSR